MEVEFEIGRYYEVPTVYGCLGGKFDSYPVLGPAHEDREIIGFKWVHYHFDYRFFNNGQWRIEEGLSPQEIFERCREAERSRLKARQKLPKGPQPSPRPQLDRRKSVRPIPRAKKKPQSQPSPNRKLPELAVILELYKDHSLRQIARIYDCSIEAVAVQLRRTDAIEKKRETYREGKKKKLIRLRAKGKSFAEIARELRIGTYLCRVLAEEAGLAPGPFKPIGCSRCETDHYARGMCRLCYARSRRRELTPKEKAFVEGVARQVRRKRYPKRGMKPETLILARQIEALKAQGKTFKEIGEITKRSASSCCILLKRLREEQDGPK